MPTRGLIVLAAVTVTTVAASGIAVDKRYRQTVLEARGGEVVFPDLRSRTAGVAVIVERILPYVERLIAR